MSFLCFLSSLCSSTSSRSHPWHCRPPSLLRNEHPYGKSYTDAARRGAEVENGAFKSRSCPIVYVFSGPTTVQNSHKPLTPSSGIPTYFDEDATMMIRVGNVQPVAFSKGRIATNDCHRGASLYCSWLGAVRPTDRPMGRWVVWCTLGDGADERRNGESRER